MICINRRKKNDAFFVVCVISCVVDTIYDQIASMKFALCLRKCFRFVNHFNATLRQSQDGIRNLPT